MSFDRDQLREAIEQYRLRGGTTAGAAAKAGIGTDLLHIVEAARLVADPDTLIISKQDGEWPVLLQVAVATSIQIMSDPARRWYELTHAQQKDWREVATDILDALFTLDALLEGPE